MKTFKKTWLNKNGEIKTELFWSLQVSRIPKKFPFVHFHLLNFLFPAGTVSKRDMNLRRLFFFFFFSHENTNQCLLFLFCFVSFLLYTQKVQIGPLYSNCAFFGLPIRHHLKTQISAEFYNNLHLEKTACLSGKQSFSIFFSPWSIYKLLSKETVPPDHPIGPNFVNLYSKLYKWWKPNSN